MPGDGLPWVGVAPHAPYFVTDDGRSWTPIGQNDAVTWPDLRGLFRRGDVGAVDRHLSWLAGHGVTCLRVMLEYAQGENRYLERPVGRFQPNMVRLWDDLFGLCARHGLRLMLTPFDTFWMRRRWRRHPYNRLNGGPAAHPGDWLADRATIEAVKARLRFVTTRWGGGGALFAWDLWNEVHPSHAWDDIGRIAPALAEIGGDLRETEMRLHGRAHPQTASLFAPDLHDHPGLADALLAHPGLDVASLHLYGAGPLDHPRDTVGPAVRTGGLMRDAIGHAPPGRPVLDSEHGPIHTFRRRTLREDFDDECFRHVQWAHLASGGAGGGLRWPYRSPHVLTHGMRRAQAAMAGFLPLVDWTAFRRRNLNEEARVDSLAAFAAFACGDARQAVAWLLRTDTLYARGRTLRTKARPVPLTLTLPGLEDGAYRALTWDTREGRAGEALGATCEGGTLRADVPAVVADVALAIRRAG